MEGSSKKGVTTTTLPSAGIRAAVVLSDLHQWMPVKYSSVDPASTNSAAILRCCIAVCTLATRALCSCALMGWTPVVIELRPAARALAASTFALSAITAAAAVNPRKARLQTVVMEPPHADKSAATRRRSRPGEDRSHLGQTGCAAIVAW